MARSAVSGAIQTRYSSTRGRVCALEGHNPTRADTCSRFLMANVGRTSSCDRL